MSRSKMSKTSEPETNDSDSDTQGITFIKSFSDPVFTLLTEKEPICLYKHILDCMLGAENGADALILFIIYYGAAKWREIKDAPHHVMKLLKWDKSRFEAAQNTLVELGIISL